MGIFDHLKDQFIASRLNEETFYQAALDEIENGTRRPGLWAKALSSSGGNEAAAKSEYLKLLVQRLKDEVYIEKRLQEQQQKELALREEQRRQEESIRQQRETAAKMAEIHQAKSQSAIDDSSSLPMLIWVGLVIGAVFLISFFASTTEDPEVIHRDSSSVHETQNPIPATVEEDHKPEPYEYEEVVSYIESRYPELDPSHVSYNEDVVSRAISLRDQYIRQGYAEIDAVLLAVHEIFGDLLTEEESNQNIHDSPGRLDNSETKVVSDPYPSCEFKAVMTDQDYRNCGIEPPRFD